MKHSLSAIYVTYMQTYRFKLAFPIGYQAVYYSCIAHFTLVYKGFQYMGSFKWDHVLQKVNLSCICIQDLFSYMYNVIYFMKNMYM